MTEYNEATPEQMDKCIEEFEALRQKISNFDGTAKEKLKHTKKCMLKMLRVLSVCDPKLRNPEYLQQQIREEKEKLLHEDPEFAAFLKK